MVDSTDRKILNLLKENSRLQFAEIGKKVNLSAPAVFARVKKMEKTGVIRRFSIEMDPCLLESGLCAFIRVVLKDVSTAKAVESLVRLKQVEEAHHVAGEDCLILKVRTRGTLELNDLLESLKKVNGIERTVTNVVLRSEFERGLTP